MTERSNKNLIDKLDVKPDMRLIIMRAPAGYTDLLVGLDERAKVVTRLGGRFDFIQYFATSVEQLRVVMPNLALHLWPEGTLWVSWSKHMSPLSADIVRDLGQKAGLIDVKVASITPDWSGLKFVYKPRG